MEPQPSCRIGLIRIKCQWKGREHAVALFGHLLMVCAILQGV